MERRKELIEMYKQMKPDMGIFIVKPKSGNKCHLETSQNLQGYINRTKFQLDAGNHPNKELQKEWKELGAENFSIDVLELLKYDKDESKTDYSEELVILRMMWEEKLLGEGMTFYKKKLN